MKLPKTHRLTPLETKLLAVIQMMLRKSVFVIQEDKALDSRMKKKIAGLQGVK